MLLLIQSDKAREYGEEHDGRLGCHAFCFRGVCHFVFCKEGLC